MLRGCAGSGREAVTAGPCSPAAAPKRWGGGDASELDVSLPELGPGVWAGGPASSPVLKHRPPSGPDAAPEPPSSSPRLQTWRTGRGWRVRELFYFGLSNMTEVVCFERRGWVGCRVEGVEVWTDGWWRGLPVLMSRRRSSGPPWSEPRPPGPGRPWS